MIIITDESKLHEAELKADSGMLLEYEEDNYDSGTINLLCIYISLIALLLYVSSQCTYRP